MNFNQPGVNYDYRKYLSALSRTLLRFYRTTCIEAAVDAHHSMCLNVINCLAQTTCSSLQTNATLITRFVHYYFSCDTILLPVLLFLIPSSFHQMGDHCRPSQ